MTSNTRPDHQDSTSSTPIISTLAAALSLSKAGRNFLFVAVEAAEEEPAPPPGEPVQAPAPAPAPEGQEEQEEAGESCNLANDVADLKDRLRQCEEREAAIEAEKAGLQAQLEDTKTELAETQEAVAGKVEELRLVSAEVERLKAITTELDARLQAAVARARALEAELATLRAREAELLSERETIQGNLTRVSDAGAAQGSQIAELNAEIANLIKDKICSVLGEVMVAAALVEGNNDLGKQLTGPHLDRFNLNRLNPVPRWKDLILSLINVGKEKGYGFSKVEQLYNIPESEIGRLDPSVGGEIINKLIPGLD